MSKDVANLDQFSKDLLLSWFLFYMPMGDTAGNAELTKATRSEFIRQFPQIYNKLVGQEVARVMHVSSGTVA
jgi:hypothetical protein